MTTRRTSPVATTSAAYVAMAAAVASHHGDHISTSSSTSRLACQSQSADREIPGRDVGALHQAQNAPPHEDGDHQVRRQGRESGAKVAVARDQHQVEHDVERRDRRP